MNKRFATTVITLAAALLVISGNAPAVAANNREPVRATVYARPASAAHAAARSDVTLMLSADGVIVSGTVATAAGDVPFAVKGSLSRSALMPERLVADAADALGNYAVVLLALERNAGVAPYFDKELANSPTLLRLYLKNKATGELVVMELNSPKVLAAIEQGWVDAYAGAPMGEVRSELWHPQFAEMVGEEVIEVDDGVDVMAMSSQNKKILYRLTYISGGKTVYEDFTVSHYLSGPATFLDGHAFHAKLYPYSEKTWSPDDAAYGGPDTFTELGYYRETRIDFVTASGDFVDAIDWGGSWQNKASMSIDFNLGWSYSIPNTPLSFAIEYQESEAETQGSHKVFTNPSWDASGNQVWVRQQGVEIPSDGYMNSTSHYLDATATVGHYNTNAQKSFQAQYKYYISNIYNYTYGGDKTQTVTHSYYSEG